MHSHITMEAFYLYTARFDQLFLILSYACRTSYHVRHLPLDVLPVSYETRDVHS